MYQITVDTRIPANDTEAIMQALQSGPVACGIHAEGLIGYTGGVLMDADGGKTSDDHSIAIVGWGSEAGTPYWTVQNNWGTRWGENGFVRVLRNVNVLGLESSCHFPTVQVPSWLLEKEK